MDFEKKYKELLVEAWAYDTQALSIIKAIESSTIEEAEALIDELVEVLTNQANSYKKRMKEDEPKSHIQMAIGMDGQVMPVIPINIGGHKL